LANCHEAAPYGVKSREEIAVPLTHNLSESPHKIQFFHFASSQRSDDALAFEPEMQPWRKTFGG